MPFQWTFVTEDGVRVFRMRQKPLSSADQWSCQCYRCKLRWVGFDTEEQARDQLRLHQETVRC